MKFKTYYSIRTSTQMNRTRFRTEGEALAKAQELCSSGGEEVSVVKHEGDVSRLVKKVRRQLTKV